MPADGSMNGPASRLLPASHLFSAPFFSAASSCFFPLCFILFSLLCVVARHRSFDLRCFSVVRIGGRVIFVWFRYVRVCVWCVCGVWWWWVGGGLVVLGRHKQPAPDATA